jgi:anti-sigma regulatory factor (Ser/Thr protein kinase)
MARASAFLTELDTDRFATCLYAQIDPATGATAIVRAGHISPLLRHADGTCSQLAVAGGLPLGLADGFEELGFPVTTTEIGPGEMLLMFSDGLVERPGADLDDGLKLLADAFRNGPDDLEHLADQLCEAMGDQGSDDDMALLLLHRDADGSPGPARRLHHHIGPGDPEALTAARAVIREALDTWELPERADDAVLVADELITNALIHTDGAAVLNVRLLPVTTPRLRIEVHDLGGNWPRHREAGDGEVSGRGLLLVSQLADAWGVEPHGGGKVVWCEIRTPRPS